MATDDKAISKLVRVGNVSVIFPDEMAVKVVFPDMDNQVSPKLPIICRGSSKNKDYWLPDVGEQVLCLMLPNGHNAGFCLGSYYSEAMPPESNGLEKRKILFSDGSYIEHDRSSGNLNIICSGDVTINGRTINLN